MHTVSTFWTAVGQSGPFSYRGLLAAKSGHLLALFNIVPLLLASLGAGRPVVRLTGVVSGRYSRAVLSLAAGWGAISLINHGLGLTGLYYSRVLGAEAWVLPALGALWIWRDRVWEGVRMPGAGIRLPAAATVVLVMGAFLLTRLPDIHEDARVYHFAAPENYLQVHKITAEPQHAAWHMPMGAEMVFLVPWEMYGVDGAKLVNVAWQVTLLLVVGGLSAALGGGAWWSALFVASCGIVISESWEGKNDLYQVIGVVGAVWCAVRSVVPEAGKERSRWWLLAGWLMGEAVGVKLTTGFYVLGMLAAVLVWAGCRIAWGRLVLSGVVFGVPFVGWLAESYIFLGNPFYPFLSGIFPSLGWGPFYGDALHELIVRFSPWEAGKWWDALSGAWRVFGDPAMGNPVVFAVLPLVLLARGSGPGFALVFAAVSWLGWTATEHLARYMFGVTVILSVVAGTTIARMEAGSMVGTIRRSLAPYALALCVLAFALPGWLKRVAPTGWKVLLGQETREEYLLERFTTWRAAIEWMNGNVPAGGRVVFTGEERRLWVVPRVRSNTAVVEPLFWRLTRDSRDAAEVRKRVKQLGLTHQLYNFLSGEFRRHVWFQGPDWDRRQLRLYHEYLRLYHRPVYVAPSVDHENGGFYVFAIEPRPLANPPGWVPFLPDAEAIFRNAKYYTDTGRYPEAIAAFNLLMKEIPPVGVIAGYLGRAFQNASDWKMAFRTVAPFVSAGLVDNVSLPVYGASALTLGRLDEAEEVLKRCVAIYPGRRDPNRVNLALVYLSRADAAVRAGGYSTANRDLAVAREILSLVSADCEPPVAAVFRQARALALGVEADIAWATGRRGDATGLYAEALRMAADIPEAAKWKLKSGRGRSSVQGFRR